jgi:hypothetical protein
MAAIVGEPRRDNDPMQKREQEPAVAASGAAAWALALVLAACSPALDWRESHPEGSGAVMMFPCRPERHERMVRIGDTTLRLQLHSCHAGGATFSLAAADVVDPLQVTPLLAALRRQALDNLSGVATEMPLPAIAGATPNAQSALLRIVGRRPDGRRVVAHTAFFVKGLRLYQATVLGADEPAGSEALEIFFASIRLP